MMGVYVQVGNVARKERLAPGYVIQENGCWEWIGAKGTGGYGRFRHAPAHRVMYERLVGPIPAGLQIDHLCRNRDCVNPAHLEPVTQTVNILRGDGWAGLHARKTHCPRGHPLEGANLLIVTHGWRRCRICYRLSRIRRYRRIAREVAQRASGNVRE